MLNAFADFVMTFSSMVCVCCPCLWASSNLVTSWRTKYTLSNFYSFVILVVLLCHKPSEKLVLTVLSHNSLTLHYLFHLFLNPLNIKGFSLPSFWAYVVNVCAFIQNKIKRHRSWMWKCAKALGKNLLFPHLWLLRLGKCSLHCLCLSRE